MTLHPETSRVKEHTAFGMTVVHFSGQTTSLDEEMLDCIHDQLLALADEPSASDVFLDLGNVDYLTSTALGTLVTLHKKLLAAGRRLILGNLRPQVHEVFALTRLDIFLDIRHAAGDDATAFEPLERRLDRWIETPAKGARTC